MITHPEKVLFPESGVTKGELCAYYEAVAPLMLPHISGRPVTMERFPAGIAKKGFIQKDVAKGFPDWLERATVPRRDETEAPVHYPVVSDARGLVWLANQNSITPHVWVSRLPDLDRPDVCVLDLDPSEQSPAELRSAALAVRDVLLELGLPSFVKTSGSKGFHILVSLEAGATFEETWRLSHGVGAVLVKRHPALFTQEFIKADRAGRILVDTGRNLRGATFAAVYAVRAKEGAPVSAPCRWEELERGEVEPQSFRLRTMAERIADHGDIWQALPTSRQSLRAPIEQLKSLLGEAEWQDAFAASSRRPVSRRRSKRS